MFAYNATAHLTYRNVKGQTQIVNYGTWLNKYEHTADFKGNTHALILVSGTRAGEQDDGQLYVFDNQHTVNIFSRPHFRSGMTVTAPSWKSLLADCTEIEMEIRNRETTLYRGTFDRVGDEWKPHLGFL